MGKLVYKGEQGRHLSDDMGQRLGWNEGSNYVTGPLLIGCLVVRCTLLLLSHASSYGHWIIYTSWLSIPTRFQNPGGKCLYLFHVSLNSLKWAHGSHDLVPPRCFLVRPADQLVIRGALKRANGMPSGWQGEDGSVGDKEPAHWWRCLLSKLDDPSLICWTHAKVGRENRFYHVVLWVPHSLPATITPSPSYTYTPKTSFKNFKEK